MAGEEITENPVVKFHFSVPFEFIAFILPSSDPTYIVPSGPMAGEEVIPHPIVSFHFKVPPTSPYTT